MKFRSKNLLVTGGCGFIGSNFIEFLLDKYKNIKIFNLDLLTYAGNLNNTIGFQKNPNYKFIKGDICDQNLLNKIFDKYNIDGVINFAAESHVDNSIINPETFIKTNVNGVFNILNTVLKFWMKKPFSISEKYKYARFHQISTDEVYGSIDRGSFTENSKYFPNSPYSASKAAADMIVRSFNKTYGINTTISICSNNYGQNQNKEKFIPKVIDCLKNNIKIPLYGDGKNVRDWIYVIDHCAAIEKIYNSSKPGNTYNIGGQNELTNLELIEIIAVCLGHKNLSDINIEYVKDRYGHDRRYSISINKLKSDFNWKSSKNPIKKLKQFLNEKR